MGRILWLGVGIQNAILLCMGGSKVCLVFCVSLGVSFRVLGIGPQFDSISPPNRSSRTLRSALDVIEVLGSTRGNCSNMSDLGQSVVFW